MEKKYNFINGDIEIDFPIPEKLKPSIEHLEKLDKENNYAFYNFAESLEYDCRYYVEKGIMTKKQWITLCNRYGGF